MVQRYSRLMMALHWLTALCVVIAWFLGEGARHVRANPPVWHFAFGLAVLLLLIPRLVARLAGGAPPPDPRVSPLLQLAATAGHAVLYVFIVFLPLSGWYAASALGVPVTILGVSLPALTTASQGAPGIIAELHSNGGTVLLILAGLHALMAIYHQFVLKDGTLRRIAPI